MKMMFYRLNYLIIILSFVVDGVANPFMDTLYVIEEESDTVGAIYGYNDSLYSFKDSILVLMNTPSSREILNITMQKELRIDLIGNDNVVFKYPLNIIIYADTSIYKLKQLICRPGFTDYKGNFKVQKITAFDTVSIFDFTADVVKNSVQFQIQSIKTGTKFALVGFNIIDTTIPANTPIDLTSDTVEYPIIIPENKKGILSEGVTVKGIDKCLFFVYGQLECKGTVTDSVDIDVNMRIVGKSGPISSNMPVSLIADYSSLPTVYTTGSRIELRNSNIWIINADTVTSLYMKNTGINGELKSTGSKVVFDSCPVYSPIQSNASWFELTGCTIEGTYVPVQNNSYMLLRDNSIRYCAGFVTNPSNSFVIMEGNKITDPISSSGTMGLNLWYNSFVIARYNIFEHGSRGVNIGYGCKGYIYNNTFVNNQTCIEFYAVVDTVTIANNIFYNDSGSQNSVAIDPDAGSSRGRENFAYLDRNLYYFNKGSYFPLSFVDTIVIAGPDSVKKADPKFENMTDYSLLANSPAIDLGLASIPGRGCSMEIMDSLITIPDVINLTGYFGNAPDAGAKEWFDPNPSDIFESKVRVEGLQSISPNPFYSKSVIHYNLLNPGRVEIDVVDIKGQVIEKVEKENHITGSFAQTIGQKRLNSGIYFVRMCVSGKQYVQKITCLR